MAATKGRIRAISVSKEKGTHKVNVPGAELQADFGIIGDAHAGSGDRQISLLGVESIGKISAKEVKVLPGDFAENITTEGIDLGALKVGSRLRLGADAEIEITQFGKRCHGRCKIFERLGDCVMPREGVFARVTAAGSIKAGDLVEVITNGD